LERAFTGHPHPGPVADENLFEILCRGPERCGMFVSARKVDACPRCGSRKIRVRLVNR